MRVKLIVTGDLERRALATSLARAFPTTHDGAPIEFIRPLKVNCATSSRLPPADGERIPQGIMKLARAMIAETLHGDRGDPADLVVAIDDLELVNRDQPEVVTAWIRRAIDAYFIERAASMTTEQRHRAALRERLSFHLLVPMVEAYMFGERETLTRAGVPAADEPRVLRPDLEDFETDDAAYLESGFAEHAQAERHPKQYLQYLADRGGVLYDDHTTGVPALAQMRWSALTRNEQTLAFARSLCEDLSDSFSVENPLGVGTLAASTYPGRSVDRRTLVLRNL